MQQQPESRAANGGPKLLLVEDEGLFAKAAAKRLERAGYRCQIAATLSEARRLVALEAFDTILLDLRLPDGNGLEWLPDITATGTPVIVLSAYGDIGDAVQAMKQGAADYLRKPLDLEELAVTVEQVLKRARVSSRLRYAEEREHRSTEIPALIGESRALHGVRDQMERLASLETGGKPRPTVLIVGETGTGKDLAARWLHWWSSSGRPFVQVDCAALPRDLIEAELFGHERGAFTSATHAKSGLIEAAEDGTLFLDEIAELPLDLQSKLLHVLERRTLRRVGSVNERQIAASFIAASNRDIPALVKNGLFRADLYYRLNVITITMPPLRARPDDIVPIARHFIAQLARRYGLPAPEPEAGVMEALRGYPWPGNVRELKHIVERALLLGSEGILRRSDLALPMVTPPSGGDRQANTLEEMERDAIAAALSAAHGNVSEASRRLGVSRMTLRYRMEKYGLKGDANEA